MYARQSKADEEVWMFDRLEENNLDDADFRLKNYVTVVDEENDDRVAFGRYRLHSEQEKNYFEISSLYVNQGAESQTVWNILLENIIQKAVEEKGRGTEDDDESQMVYSFVDESRVPYFETFGFEETDETALPDPLRTSFTLKKERLGRDELSVVQGEVDELYPEEEEEDVNTKEGEDLSDEEVEQLADEMGVNTKQSDFKYST